MIPKHNGTLILYYKRVPGGSGDRYTGRFEIASDTDDWVEHFIGMSYKDVIYAASHLLNTHAITAVYFQRTERDDIGAVELGGSVLEALRNNPEEAYKSLTHQPTDETAYVEDDLSQVGKFGECVYLAIVNGYVEDPETGNMLGLAYGPKHGWRIRRDDNKASKWIPIQLIDQAVPGTTFAEKIASTKWAKAKVEDLLAQDLERYYIPRAWNVDGPWISKESLEKMWKDYSTRKGIEVCQ